MELLKCSVPEISIVVLKGKGIEMCKYVLEKVLGKCLNFLWNPVLIMGCVYIHGSH